MSEESWPSWFVRSESAAEYLGGEQGTSWDRYCRGGTCVGRGCDHGCFGETSADVLMTGVV
jgi:hypothetical protein